MEKLSRVGSDANIGEERRWRDDVVGLETGDGNTVLIGFIPGPVLALSIFFETVESSWLKEQLTTSQQTVNSSHHHAANTIAALLRRPHHYITTITIAPPPSQIHSRHHKLLPHKTITTTQDII
ncbi:Hypothetical predicted protein [Olea europaea subsp. europaea]|uniref:Uncharacterized protein n=1 Tax=Olea europaea subsp. europaea TaxID=158383 RepID=A0A8S0QU88_OLEEU|nr:Hypothetical predicted protein [Olea europaea subsp. europaea]